MLYIPVLTVIFDHIARKSKVFFNNSIRITKRILFALSLVIFTFFYPKVLLYNISTEESNIGAIKLYSRALKPVFTKDEYKVRIWSSLNIKDKTVYYPEIGYKIPWLEAISEKPQLYSPENFRRIVVADHNKAKWFREFIKKAKEGDIFMIDSSKLGMPKSNFNVLYSKGNIYLLEFTVNRFNSAQNKP